MPTSTPIPDSVLFTQAQRLLEITIQQGVVGFLLFVGFIGACVALAYLIKAYAQRNRPAPPPPPDPTEGMTNAVNALAESITASNRSTDAANKRLDDLLAAQREKETLDRAQDKEQSERYVDNLAIQSDATNNLADALKKLGTDNLSLRDEVGILRAQGTKPLNELIIKFDSLQKDVQEMKATTDGDHQAFEVILHDIAEIKAIVISIDKRRATSEFSRAAEAGAISVSRPPNDNPTTP